MAIDMIEDSQLPAAMVRKPNYIQRYSTDFGELSEKTDGNYSNISGLAHISLFGAIYETNKENKQISADKAKIAVMAAINKTYPIPSKNCTSLTDARNKIKAEVLKINNEIVAGDNAKTKKDWLNALNARDTIFKNMQTDLKCQEQLEQSELEKSKQDILDALNDAGNANVAKSGFDKISNYFLWGIAGVMVLGAVYILLKKKPANSTS